MELQVGNRFLDRYDILELINRGSLGNIYKAKDRQKNQYVAIKMLQCTEAGSIIPWRRRVYRFVKEHRILSRLQGSEHIVQLYDFGEWGEDYYLVLEYIEGKPLSHWKGKHWDFPLLTHVIRQCLQGLATMHSKKMIHRDFKPSNIMVTGLNEKDEPDLAQVDAKVIDLNLVKTDTTQGETASDELVGTLFYMAPEQFKREHIDARSDLYSVGVVMYEMATGHYPIQGNNAIDLVFQLVGNGQPEPISSYRPEILSELDQLILRLLQKNKEDRPESASEVIDILNSIGI
ncbi:MAG: serine/threonine protein kinase [Gemmatimonadetes bacterium]|nr:MAG: serine/threonine protein kinase [Gemmatimonadota bacterium]